MDGPAIESQCEQNFLHPSRQALGPTQSPVQGVRDLFPVGKVTGRGFDHTRHLASRSNKEYNYVSTFPLELHSLLYGEIYFSNVWCGIYIMQFFPASCYFLSFRTKYIIQHLLLEQSEPMFFLSFDEPIQNNRQIIILYNLILFQEYATTNECYNEQFLSIKSGCYNEHRCYNERGGILSADVARACP